MFIVLLTYQKPLEDVNAHLVEHREFLERNYAEGTFLLSGRKEPRDGGFVLARSPSLQELKEVLSQDPFSLHGIAAYSITEVIPSKSSPELASLLEA